MFKCRNHAIAMLYSFPALLTLLLHQVAVMSFLPFVKCKWRGISSWRKGEKPQKFKGDKPHLNNSRSVWRKYAHTFQRTKCYLFYCSIFYLDWIFVSKSDDKIIKIVTPIQIPWTASVSVRRPTVRATAYRLTREMGISNNLKHEIILLDDYRKSVSTRA